jgi:hypothetical protein
MVSRYLVSIFKNGNIKYRTGGICSPSFVDFGPGVVTFVSELKANRALVEKRYWSNKNGNDRIERIHHTILQKQFQMMVWLSLRNHDDPDMKATKSAHFRRKKVPCSSAERLDYNPSEDNDAPRAFDLLGNTIVSFQ